MPNDQLDGLLNRLVSGTGEVTGSELEQLRSAIFGASQNGELPRVAEIAAALDAPEDADADETLPCELKSAEDYLARVAAVDQPVPASLLRLVGAAPAIRTTAHFPDRASRLAGLRSKHVLPWGSAIAATVLAGISGYFVHDFLVHGSPAPATVVLPNDLAEARAPQSANSTVANTGSVPPQEPGSSANTPVPTLAVTPPTPLTSHAVKTGDYPPESIRLQEQGTVQVKYLVLINGSVGECQVENSSGHSNLDDAACVLVRRWRFKPAALTDGTAVDWWVEDSVAFRLAGGAANSTPPQAPAVANAQGGSTPTRGIQSKNEALIKAINEMNAAARAQNWTLALEKAKEADSIKDDKPAALNAPIHAMIVSAAINAHDYVTALAELDREIASGEGNKTQELKQALGVAIIAKNEEKTDQYAKELGGNLDNATRLFIASNMMNSGQLQEALDYAKPALEGNPSEAALKFEEAVYFKMNNLAGRRAALEQLVTSYPKLEYWHDLLQLVRTDKSLKDDQTMDIYRLRLAVGDLKTDADFQEMAQEALVAGYATEAKSVLDKAQAENLLSGERDQRLMQIATDRAAQDGAAIADLKTRAAADPNSAVKLGLLLWSIGKTREAENTIRAAMTSGNLGDPDAAKMALGHALLSERKNQEAAAAFRSVRGPNTAAAAIATMWASYAASPAPSSVSQLRSPTRPPIPTTSHAVTTDDYPPVSIRLQEQGKVGIKYLVKEDGTVGDCNVITSSGKARLDDAACTMAKRRWKFAPARQNGKAVAEFLTAEVIFELK